MRKILLFTSLIFITLLLYGCNKNEPVIKLTPKEVIVDINEDYDLMTGVFAKDKNNRDITKNVTYEQGNFNTIFEGTYEIVYSVKDKFGNVSSVTRTIIVKDSIDEHSPQIENPTSLIVEFNNYKLTKEQLYTKMKKDSGLTILLRMIDSDIFSNVSVDNSQIENDYNNIIEKYGEQNILDTLTQLGIFREDDESDEDFNNRVLEYFKFSYLIDAGTYKHAYDTTTASDVALAKENYREDLCVINLRYSNKADADSFLESLSDLDQSQILEKFKTNYTETTKDEDTNYLASQISCDYSRYVYDNISNKTFRDFVFDSIPVNSFNSTPKLISGYYYLIYVVNKANDKNTYDNNKFDEELKQRIVDKKYNDQYAKQALFDIRKEHNLKIYDPFLAYQYGKMDINFTGLSTIGDKTIVASYDNKTVTAEEFYNKLITSVAAPTMLNELNYQALKSVNLITLNNNDLLFINQNIDSLKEDFLSKGLNAYIKFSDYTNYYYNVTNEEDLIHYFSLEELSKRYILGYNEVYPGVNPVSVEEIEKAIDNYFNVRASHILFTFDKNDEESKEIAYLKAMQVIRGVNDGETAYIKLDDNNFKGLDKIDANNYETEFGKIAKEYSDDKGSGTYLGDLGFFTQGKMVKPFEDAVRELIKTGVNTYTLTPIESEFGYHIILLTDIKETPEKPIGYDNLPHEQLKFLIENDEQVRNYYEFITEINESLAKQHYTKEIIDNKLTLLRDSLNIVFNDNIIQKHYLALKEIDLR